MLNRIAVLAAVTAIGSGCGKSDSGDSSPTAQPPAAKVPTTAVKKPAAPAAKPLGKIYQVKSGIVHYKSVSKSSEDTEVLYFDDFGRKQATHINRVIKIGKQRIEVESAIYLDGLRKIDVNPKKKTGSQTLLKSRASAAVDYDKLVADKGEKDAAAYLARFKMEKLADADVLGHTCQVIRTNRMKGTQTMYHHKGVMLKMDVTASAGKIKTARSKTATKVEFDVAVPADRLSPAADIVLEAQKTEQQRVDDYLSKVKEAAEKAAKKPKIK